MLKKIIILITLPIIVLLIAYFYAVYQNNRDVDYPSAAKMQQQYEKSIWWLVNNEAKILPQTNPMLWWMLFEVQKITPDKRIENLLKKYHQRNPHIINSVWGPLFNGMQHRRLAGYSVASFPYYNQHFIYALNCAAGIADESFLVEAQNAADFCHQADYFYRPACISHQLMGINFLRTKECGFLSNINEVTQSLQSDLVTQLTWDIRVVDVYLQRVLMLLITGAEDSVKSVWIQQILSQQLDDGGWGNFVPLIGLGENRFLGLNARGISLGQKNSDFHATAQGVYILAYLLNKD